MARKRRRSPYATDTLKEGLQEGSVKSATGATYDDSGPLRTRSYSRYQRILDDLAEFSPSDVARELGISVQKYNHLRGMLEYHEASTGTINDLLSQAARSLNEKVVRLEYDIPVQDTRTGKIRNIHIESVTLPEDEFDEEYPDALAIKSYTRRSLAANYIGKIGGGAEYFLIRKRGTGKRARYEVVDIRPPSEQGHKMKKAKRRK